MLANAFSVANELWLGNPGLSQAPTLGCN